MMREASICSQAVSDASYLGRVAPHVCLRERIAQGAGNRHTLEPSGVGNVWRSTTVIEVYVNSGFLQSAHAVERPNAPLPTMMTDLGTSGVDDEDAREDIVRKETQEHTRAAMEKAQSLLQSRFSQIYCGAPLPNSWANFYSDVVAARVGKGRLAA